MTVYKLLVLTVCITALGTVCRAQVSIQRTQVHPVQPATATTAIVNKATGQPITMEEYGKLIKDDPYAYHLVPDYNEYGQPGGYIMRPATPEEHETHRFRDRDPAKQPKAGQSIAPFVMTGLDGKTYRSADLLGKIVILSFWVSLDKPVWNDKQGADFAEALRPYQSKNGLVVLGVLNSEQPKNVDLKAVPFIPVPNAYGFHNKYHITTIPTVVVIDKAGKVAANLQGVAEFDKLKQILIAITQ